MSRRFTHEEAVERLVGLVDVCNISPYPGTQYPWPMECSHCGRDVSPILNNLIKGGRGACKHCSGKAKLTHCEAVSNLGEFPVNVRNVSPYPGSGKPWPMQCGDCGKSISPSLNNIRKGGGACKYCAGCARFTHDQAVKILNGLVNVRNVSEYPGVDRPWKMECGDCGKSISPCLGSLKSGNGPCKHCGKLGGYNWTSLGRSSELRWRASHLYVRQIEDAGRVLYKVGIGTANRSRAGRGRVIRLEPMPLAVAFVAEQSILSACDRVDLVQPLEFGGSTEVVADLDVIDIWVKSAQAWALECVNDGGRERFEADHFPSCEIGIGRQMALAV